MLQAVDYRNSWIVAVDRAERPWPLWAALLYGIAVFAAAYFAAQTLFPALTDGGRNAEAYGWAAVVVELTFFAVLLAGGLAGVRLIERRAAKPGTRALRRLGLGLGTGTAAFLTTLGVCAAVGVLKLKGVGGVGVAAAGSLALSSGMVLFGAAAEETFFRGWLQPLLSAKIGPWVGVALTALIFSVSHALGHPLGMLSLINGALAGALFGVLALRTGSLVAPVAAHFAWNWVEKPVLGLFPNPGVDGLGAVVDLELAGASLWTGGGASLNGALSTSVGLGLACVALVLLPGVGRR